jgi:hypothetical protein
MRLRALAYLALSWLVMTNAVNLAKPLHYTHQNTKPRKKRVRQCPAKPFEAGCELPFPNGILREIDRVCPKEGVCTTGRNTRLQNEIKNNFCAKGPAVEIGIASLDQLQTVVDQMVSKRQFSYGKGHVPPKPAERVKLRSLPTVDVHNQPVMLSEGSLVTFEGFVLEAKHDYSFPLLSHGERENCNNPALEWNDIHISLGDTPTAAECTSVTAKISPHFRPASWERIDSNRVTAEFVIKPLPVKQLRIKVTGQLFFDGSHLPRPCQIPKRRTSWEIHPVYAIEVFDPALDKFVDFDDWAKTSKQ